MSARDSIEVCSQTAIFRTLEDAILEAWSSSFDGSCAAQKTSEEGSSADIEGARVMKPKKPLYIREGGSIPAIRFLEKEFEAPAAHMPCGQASDSAHLDNERMSVLNLVRAREIFGKVFERL